MKEMLEGPRRCAEQHGMRAEVERLLAMDEDDLDEDEDLIRRPD